VNAQIQKIFEFEFYPVQMEVFQCVRKGVSSILLKSPTGSGKTEAVLAPFLSQFLENSFYIAPRLIYVLPMRVMVNNVAQRIKKYAEKISPLISVKIQHGDVPDSPFFIADIVHDFCIF
jgi:CRISPR-associated endonuclease/helicase Cas3